MVYQERPLRMVEFGQRVPAFEFPLDEWGNYSHIIAIDPGKCSHFLLRTGDAPDLHFVTAMQRSVRDRLEGITNNQWPIWVEAYRYDLRDLGLLEKRFPRRGSLAFGGSGLEGYIFTPEALEKVRALRLQMFVPEGEYLAVPNPQELQGGSLKFDVFTQAGSQDERLWRMASWSEDEDYLRAIDIIFTRAENVKKEKPIEEHPYQLRSTGFRRCGGLPLYDEENSTEGEQDPESHSSQIDSEQQKPSEVTGRGGNEIEKRYITITNAGITTKYLRVGRALFACDENGKPERFVGLLPPEPKPGRPRPFRFGL